MSRRIEEARLRYKPQTTRYLFVAESPPPEDSERFFHFEDVREHDGLFIQTMRVLYPHDCALARASEIRSRKASLLRRFRDDGFYLIDATDESLGNASDVQKRMTIRESLPLLHVKMEGVTQSDTAIILISRNVYDICYEPLVANGRIPANVGMIDFPASGRQPEFREKLGRLMQMLGWYSEQSSTISGDEV